jgi:hypothetical protein
MRYGVNPYLAPYEIALFILGMGFFDSRCLTKYFYKGGKKINICLKIKVVALHVKHQKRRPLWWPPFAFKSYAMVY